jgi:sialate O-acetylesterase
MTRWMVRSAVLGATFWGLAAATSAAQAAVALPPCLSPHMVLQRDKPVPLWGTAAPGEKVTVTFRDQSQTATADEKGNWSLKLAPLRAGGPDVLAVKGTNEIAIDDVLVGEVWVGSGQSNMQGNTGGYVKGDPVLEGLASKAPYPRIRLLTSRGKWVEATPQAVNGFSALLFSFGVRLQEQLDVPVGLLQGAVGGTPSGPWLSKEAFAADEACQAALAKFRAGYDFAVLQKSYEEDLAKWEQAAEAAKKDGKNPPPRPVPPRKAEDLAAEVGGLFEQHIRLFVGYGIRGVLWDQGESGTKVSGVDQYTMMGALIRGWRKEWGVGEFPFLYVQKPSGGGPAFDPTDPATNKAEPFTALPATVPADGAYREVHLRIRSYPQTEIVTATDLGSGLHPSNKSGYGSRAARVALALAYGKPVEGVGPTYAEHKVEGGAIRVKFAHVGKGLVFRHGEKLQGFAVAGEDKTFRWAEARIDGDSVIVSSPDVPKPVAVRYAYAGRHPWANLFNADGLPALSFRTDEW